MAYPKTTQPFDLIVSHDAGGAEALLHYVLGENLRCKFFLEGPAVNIFAKHFEIKKHQNFNQMLKECSRVITSTSWASALEFDAIKESKRRFKHCSSLLDHWVHYEERFIRGNERALPDRLLVVDEIAEKKASLIFPNTCVQRVKNYQKIFAIERAARLKEKAVPEAQPVILYISEPLIRFKQFVPNAPILEKELLIGQFKKHFVENSGKNFKLIIRRHPSNLDSLDDVVFSNLGLPTEYSSCTDLVEDIVRSDVVVGARSMAMVVAHWLGKPVFCLLRKDDPSVLPIENMQYLHEMVP